VDEIERKCEESQSISAVTSLNFDLPSTWSSSTIDSPWSTEYFQASDPSPGSLWEGARLPGMGHVSTLCIPLLDGTFKNQTRPRPDGGEGLPQLLEEEEREMPLGASEFEAEIVTEVHGNDTHSVPVGLLSPRVDAWRGFRPRVGGAIGSPVLRKHKLDVEGIGQPPGLGVPPGLNTPCADLGPLVAARKQEQSEKQEAQHLPILAMKVADPTMPMRIETVQPHPEGWTTPDQQCSGYKHHSVLKPNGQNVAMTSPSPVRISTVSVNAEDLPEDVPSVGSLLHFTGDCKPCAWFWKPGRCMRERSCRHCHLCPDGELKARKAKKKQSLARFANEESDEPEIDGEDSKVGETSQGSQLHGTGECKPCAWFWKPQKCFRGADCGHCHLCPRNELKTRKKTKVAKFRFEVLPPEPSESSKQPNALSQTSLAQVHQVIADWCSSPPSPTSGFDPSVLRDGEASANLAVMAQTAGFAALGVLADPFHSPLSAVNLADSWQIQADANDELPSHGSLLHRMGRCRPCAWYHKADGCHNGASCCHCHLCPEGEIRNRRKAKEAAMRAGPAEIWGSLRDAPQRTCGGVQKIHRCGVDKVAA